MLSKQSPNAREKQPQNKPIDIHVADELATLRMDVAFYRGIVIIEAFIILGLTVWKLYG